MNKDNSYYLSIANKIEEFIKENNSYSINSTIKPSYCTRAYYFDEERDFSYRKKLQHQEDLKTFITDFKDYLFWNSKLEILGKALPRSFVLELSIYIYDSHSHDPIYPPRPIIPSVEEFTKIIKCFGSHIQSIDLLIHNAPSSINGKHINSYLKEVLSLNNKELLSKLHFDDFKEVVNDELSILANRFINEKDPEIKDGILNYLSNRESILEKNKDKNFEIDLFKQLKAILHSDYWAEVQDYFPNMRKEKNKPTEFTNAFILNSNPIYYIDLNKDYILGISKSIITDKDFSNMISSITESINLHKPDNIDFITPTPINGQLKVFISSADLTQDMVIKIGKLFESMIMEYNSDNVIQTGNYSGNIDEIEYNSDNVISTGNYRGNIDEIISKNQKYLNKVAETYWLELEIDVNPTTNINKKLKI